MTKQEKKSCTGDYLEGFIKVTKQYPWQYHCERFPIDINLNMSDKFCKDDSHIVYINSLTTTVLCPGCFKEWIKK